MRGGGIGLYIRNTLSFKIIENLSPFANKIFECITVQLTYPATNKSVLLSCAYRSNGVIPGVTAAQQMEDFYGLFGDLLANIQNLNKDSYIFIDSNINLLELNNQEPQNYLNLLFATGFLQSIVKATQCKMQASPLLTIFYSTILITKLSLVFC